jgi:hypothetical protein
MISSMTSSASFSERLTLSANLAMAVLIMMERMLSAFSDQRSAKHLGSG